MTPQYTIRELIAFQLFKSFFLTTHKGASYISVPGFACLRYIWMLVYLINVYFEESDVYSRTQLFFWFVM